MAVANKEFKKIMSNIKRPYKMIENIKYTSSLSLKKQLIDKISSGGLPGRKIYYGKALCTDLEHLIGTTYIAFNPYTSIKVELEWLLLKLGRYKEEINMYLSYKSEYEYALLQGNYEDALSIINKINSITYSFWGIEQELLCLELKDGYEANSRRLSEYTQELKKTISIIFAQFSSDRVSVLNTNVSFQHKINNFVDSLGDSFTGQVLEEFVKFYFKGDYTELSVNKAKLIFSFIDLFPVIDMYEMSLKLVSVLLAKNLITFSVLKEIWNVIPGEIHDTRIYNLNNVFNMDEKSLHLIKEEEYFGIAEIIESYTNNEFNKAEELIKLFIIKFGINSTVFDILIKCSIYSGKEINDFSFIKNEVLQKLFKSIKNVYIAKETDRNISEIKNLAKLFEGINFNIIGDLICSDYTLNRTENEIYWELSKIYSKVLTPLKFQKDSFMLDILSKYGFDESSKLFTGNFANVNDFRMVFYKAKSLQEYDIKESIQLLETKKSTYENFNEDSSIYEYERLIKELFNMYSEEGLFEIALDLIIESYFINKNLITRLDPHLLLTSILKNQSILNSCDKLKLAVLYYITYSNNTYELYRSLTLLTSAFGLNFPSEFFDEEKFNLESLGNDKKILFYVLKNMYKQEVMKHYVFIDPNNRNSERLIILLNLLKFEYGDSSNIFEEIEMIIKMDSIKKRIVQIDQKKIFVDTDSILNKYEEVYLDRFRRYLVLDKLDVDITRFDTSDISNYFVLNEKITNEFIKAPEKKLRFVLFKEMVVDYIKELSLNKNYGLEKFLSSRIRHGTLENALTNVLSRNNLISMKEDLEDEIIYKNYYREDQLSKVEDIIARKLILDELNTFSTAIIGILEKVTEWIKVKTNTQKNGLFDYNYFENDINLKFHYSNFNEIKNFKVFYGKITDLFWEHTSDNLIILREKIEDEVYNLISDELEKLENNLRNISTVDENIQVIIGHIIKDIINAKAKFRNDLLEINKWLIVRRNNEFHDFDIEEVVETSIEINNKANNGIRHSKSINTSNLILKGKYFSYFVDIFTMIYSNAVKHSGFPDIKDLEIYTNIRSVTFEQFKNQTSNRSALKRFDYSSVETIFDKENQNVILISIENNLHPTVDQTLIAYKIREKLNMIKQEDIPEELILGEGGTGILKVYSLLFYNIGARAQTLYYVDNDKFHVDILIKLERVSK
ncbi:hypothetical protein P9436_06575 [Lysinibacillus capsici]|uniref:hypothetical protein n=1 Tax=Lysinibacillus capsici TaxID=2115968 RepID=UPI002E1F7271|nr:hypothetical protein [Lysinibacillus capsici]